MVSSSCSTTITVLPSSRSSRSDSMSLRLSRWCSPIDGSAGAYNTPALFADVVVVGLVIPTLEHRNETFVVAGVFIGAVAALERKFDLVFRAVQDAVAGFFRQLAPGSSQREFEVLRERVDLPHAPVL